jgi:predicted DNA-binding transcriptional regulator AlpA
METPEFYNTSDIMRILRIGSRSSLYRMRQRKDIPAPIQITRSHYLWPKKEFDAFLAEKQGAENVTL